MNDDFKEVIQLLYKCSPILLKNPEVMTGCDISDEEIEEIKQTKKLSIKVLEHVAGDDFFETYYDEVNLTKGEAVKVGRFLSKTAKFYFEELQEKLSFLKE